MATLRDYFASLAQNGSDEQRAAFYRGEDLSRFYPQMLAANPQTQSWGIDLNNLDSPVPDPLKGNMFQDSIGALSVLALPFMVAGITGALGTAGASAGAGGTSALGGIEAAGLGAVPGTVAGEAIGAVPSTLGSLMDGSWGVNPTGTVAGSETGAFDAGGSAGVFDSFGNPLYSSPAAGAGAAGAGSWLTTPGGGLFGLSPMQTMMGASTLGSLVQGGASLLGANTQANAANRATDATLGMFNTLNAQGAPYRAAGYSALGQIMDPSMQSYLTHQFGPEDLQKGLAPGYEFMRDQGLRAARNAANAQTGLVSGNTMKGLTEFAENYALNQGYQPAFQNFESQRQGIYNRLASIAGLGQTANNQSVAAGSALGPAAAQSIQNYGTALGGGFVGAGNALASGLNNAASWYTLPAILNMGRA